MSVYPCADIERAASGADGLIDHQPRALVVEVLPESPADDAGFEPGCYLVSVDGAPIRDIIDWRWLSAEDEITLRYVDLDGSTGEVDLEREAGENWGFSFDGVVFDGIKQCRNACTFCFMRQLPEDLRPSLTLRDDDFRLSFLSGTFVTFTNLQEQDEARIIEQRISPLRVSLHAYDSNARRALMGKHAQHGLDVIERLLDAGIEMHAQIVLVPGANDGDVLQGTMAWAYEHPGIINIGIVPLGYTRHQSNFVRSFNKPETAQAVLQVIEPYQRRAGEERGTPWVYAADEFYRNAYGFELLEKLPPANHYGDFSLFEDGIGIIRTQVDEWAAAEKAGLVQRAAEALCEAQVNGVYLAGCAMQEYFSTLLQRGPLADFLKPVYVQNTFFGGNVDVTGLLCGCDIVAAIQKVNSARTLFVFPDVLLNDQGVTLDDMSLEDMEKAAGVAIAVVSCNVSEFLEEITALARAQRACV